MQRVFLAKWTAVNALGMAAGFLAVLQTGFLIQFGLNTELHWTPRGLGQGVSIYARFAGLLLGGAILGSAQAFALRRWLRRVIPWIVLTAAGFGLVVAGMWPLWSMGLWGRIPGPVEPIMITVGGGTLAGVFQYLFLRKLAVPAGKWLRRWIGGLVLSLAPTAAVFILLEAVLRVPLSWPAGVALSGLLVGGIAALVSGRALLSIVLTRLPTPGPAGL